MKYRIELLTDYGEQWRTSVERDPDATIHTFSVRMVDESGQVWAGVLSPEATPLPPTGRTVVAGIEDTLPFING